MNKITLRQALVVASTSLAVASLLGAAPSVAKESQPLGVRSGKSINVPEQQDPTAPAIIKKVLQGNGKVLASFTLENLPLTGWAVLPDNSPGKAEIVYTTADGRFAFIGPLLEVAPNGELMNQSARFTQQFSPKINMGPIWDQLDKTRYIKEGAPDEKAKFILYGFMDPNCTYCRQAWQQLEPYTQAGLQVRWIPVGLIAPTSKSKAAALLEATDPTSAMKVGYREWETKKGDAFATSKSTNGQVTDKLDEHAKLMSSMGVRGTPAFVYKDAQGNIQKVSGVIPLADIPKITGLPAIPNATAKK